MEDRRAHTRIDAIEITLEKHLTKINSFEQMIEMSTASLKENTKLTKEIAINTADLVDLVRGIKGFRKLLIWASPIVAIIGGLIIWIRDLK